MQQPLIGQLRRVIAIFTGDMKSGQGTPNFVAAAREQNDHSHCRR